MKAYCYTNKGPSRPTNQDGIFVFTEKFVEIQKPFCLEQKNFPALVAVVDGMGGMGGGEKATSILLEEFAKNSQVQISDSSQISELLQSAARSMKQFAMNDPDCARMGAVVAGVSVVGDTAMVFNCGDSRVYQIRGGFFQKLTHDHSAVQELCDENLIDEDAMRSHPRKNVVTSAVSADNVCHDVFCKHIKIKQGNTFFICSDGIWEIFSLEELESLFSQDLEIFADKIITESQKRATDNISFIIINI